LVAALADPQLSGFYEAQLTALDGQIETRYWAYDVAPEEGDLEHLDNADLAGRLDGLRIKYHDLRDLNHDLDQLAGFNLGDNLMGLLVALLLGEQVLAYAASYHPSSRRGAHG
jgi:hypothetical protein